MVEIFRADYMSESTEDLIRRAEQILSRPDDLYPKADDIIPYSRNGFGFMTYPTYPTYPSSIRSLSPSCNRIEVKNVITITDSSIIICTGAATGTCPGIPPSCPVGVIPTDYVNMVATVTALVAQSGVKIAFEYLLNDIPTTTEISGIALAAGSNTVYAFPANIQYAPDTTISLFGARVTKY